MELSGLECRGCGSSNVTFDAKSRKLICNQCGREDYYSRATLNSTGKVVFGKDNAINFFKNGKFDNAQHYAMDVLNISKDNAPSLFIMSYYDEFMNKRAGALKKFFEEINDVSLEYDEVRALIQLIEASAYNLSDYEIQVLTLIAVNMQSPEDSKELCDFVDKICPYFIKKRPSMDFFTKDLREIYKELAEHCDIPKTCFALLKAIDENPDSPYVNNSFYLQSKARYFYDNYIIPVSDVIGSIRNDELRMKFVSSYNKKKLKYEQDANI